MKKIKILLLGFLAVLMVGVVSLASAPVTYADETESIMPDYTLIEQSYGQPASEPGGPGAFIYSIENIVDEYRTNGLHFTYYDADTAVYEIIVRDGNIVYENMLGENLFNINVNELENILDVGFEILPIQGGPMTLKIYFDTEEIEISMQPFIVEKNNIYLPDTRAVNAVKISFISWNDEVGEIIDTNNPGKVPPLVNEKGNISPVYLYSGLIVIALGIGAYVYTLGKNKKGKRK